MTGRCLALALWVIGMSATLPAECVVGRVPDMKRHAAFVFDGTVTVVKPVRALEQAATIEATSRVERECPERILGLFRARTRWPFRHPR